MSAKDHLQPDQFMFRRKKQLEQEEKDRAERDASKARHPAGSGRDDDDRHRPPSK